MSGGVDSSVAAALAVEAGHEAVGVTLKLLPREGMGFGCCGSPSDVNDAQRVCETLGIPHYVVDLAKVFEDKVIKPFIDAYHEARTPNPCVECNRSLKFGTLLGLADAWGCAKVATGHYARVEGGRMLRAVDEAKDQTYFLYMLKSRELERALFPIGSLTKAQVREKARSLGLGTAEKPESQEICFIPGRDYRKVVGATPAGPIKDVSGRLLGEHAGLSSYTVGQRKGLGLPGGEARYVVELERESNTLVVGSDQDVFSSGFAMENVSWAAEAPSRASVRIRHRHVPAAASVEGSRVVFDQPQRAVTPGQAAVFYDGEAVLGGGTITRRIP